MDTIEIKSPAERYKAIADAIREKNNTTELLQPIDMPQAIRDIAGGGGAEEIEDLIDSSRVLDSTEGTVSEKVEQLIDKVEELDIFTNITYASQLFHSTKSFPTKVVVNLPNAITVYQAFAYWNTEPIPIAEELTVKAPNINVSNNQSCMGQMFVLNKGVKKVILNLPDESQYMVSTFSNASNLEEVVLNFLTKNIQSYNSTFTNCNALKRIVGVLDFSSATVVQYMFNACNNLEEVRFEPNTLSLSISLGNSDKLTLDSVQSIFDGLAVLAEDVTQTLTFHKNVKILQSQVDSANAKGWTVAGGTIVSEEGYYE